MATITERLKDIISTRLAKINEAIDIRMGGEDSDRIYKVFIQTEEGTIHEISYYTDMFIIDEYENTKWRLCRFGGYERVEVLPSTLTLREMDVLLSKIALTIRSIDDDQTHPHVEHVLRFPRIYAK